MKPAIKKPDADTITVPIQRSFGGQFRKQEEEKHQSLSSSTEVSVHPPWRYGAEMSSMNSSSTEMSVSQKSSTIRRSQLEQRERRVSALKTWPSTTTKPECNGAGQGQAGEVLHFPVSVWNKLLASVINIFVSNICHSISLRLLFSFAIFYFPPGNIVRLQELQGLSSRPPRPW